MLTTAAASGGANPGAIIGGVLGGLVAVFLYWLPTFIGWRRRVPNLGSIAVINFFGFALGVGWIVAMAMAARSRPPEYVAPVQTFQPPGR